VENPRLLVENVWILWGKVLGKIKIYFLTKRYLKQHYGCVKTYMVSAYNALGDMADGWAVFEPIGLTGLGRDSGCPQERCRNGRVILQPRLRSHPAVADHIWGRRCPPVQTDHSHPG